MIEGIKKTFYRSDIDGQFEFDTLEKDEVRRKKKQSLCMHSLSESEYPENRMRILVWDRVRGRWDIGDSFRMQSNICKDSQMRLHK